MISLEPLKRIETSKVIDMLVDSTGHIALYHSFVSDEIIYCRAALIADTGNDRLYSFKLKDQTHYIKLENELYSKSFALIYPDPGKDWIQLSIVASKSVK